MKKIVLMGFVLALFSFSVQAKPHLVGSSKDKIDSARVDVSFYDHGQFKGCEEMGAYWVAPNLPKGLKEVKKVKKEAAKVGANKVLFQMGVSVLFHCSSKVGS